MNKVKIALIAFILLAPGASHAQSDPPEWTACENDSDCVVASGRCSFDWAINKNYLEPANAAAGRWESCDKTGAPDMNASAKCADKKCVLTDQN